MAHLAQQLALGLLQMVGHGACTGVRIGALLSLGFQLLLEAGQGVPLPPQVIFQPTPTERVQPDAHGLKVKPGADLDTTLCTEVLLCRWSSQMGRLYGRMLLRSASRGPSCVTVPDRQAESRASLFVNRHVDLQGGHVSCNPHKLRQIGVLWVQCPSPSSAADVGCGHWAATSIRMPCDLASACLAVAIGVTAQGNAGPYALQSHDAAVPFTSAARSADPLRCLQAEQYAASARSPSAHLTTASVRSCRTAFRCRSRSTCSLAAWASAFAVWRAL